MNRHADFSPQGPRTNPRAWSFRWRPTSPRSCGLKSACRVGFMAGEQGRKDEVASHEPPLPEGRDAFHCVPDISGNDGDAVERVPTGSWPVSRSEWNKAATHEP